MRVLHPTTAVVLLLGCFCGCSHQKQLSREELQSQVTKAVSFTAETELLAEFVLAGHSTRHYAQEHAAYLNQEIEETLKDIAKSQPEPADTATVQRLQDVLRAISRELDAIQASPTEEGVFTTAKKHVAPLREQLQRMR